MSPLSNFANVQLTKTMEMVQEQDKLLLPDVVKKIPCLKTGRLLSDTKQDNWYYILKNNNADTIRCSVLEEHKDANGKVCYVKHHELRAFNGKSELPYYIHLAEGATEAHLSFQNISRDHEKDWAGTNLLPDMWIKNHKLYLQFTNHDQKAIPGRGYIVVFREGTSEEIARPLILENVWHQISPGESQSACFILDEGDSLPKVYATQYRSLLKHGEELKAEEPYCDPELVAQIKARAVSVRNYSALAAMEEKYALDSSRIFTQGILIENQANQPLALELELGFGKTNDEENWQCVFRALQPKHKYFFKVAGHKKFNFSIQKAFYDKEYEQQSLLQLPELQRDGELLRIHAVNSSEKIRTLPDYVILWGESEKIKGIQEVTQVPIDGAIQLAPGAERNQLLHLPTEMRREKVDIAEAIYDEGARPFNESMIPQLISEDADEPRLLPVSPEEVELWLQCSREDTQGEPELIYSNLSSQYLMADIEVQYWVEGKMQGVLPFVVKLAPKQKEVRAKVCDILAAFNDLAKPVKNAESRIILSLWIDQERPLQSSEFTYLTKEDGSIDITGGKQGYAEELTIPGEINGKVVSEISHLPFDAAPWIQKLFIPESVHYMSSYCLASCMQKPTIIYQGSQEEWKNLGFDKIVKNDFKVIFEKK